MSDTTQFVEYASQLAEWTLQDGNNLMLYLATLAKFPDLSLNNQLLIMGYKSDAEYIKSYEDWLALGVTVNGTATAIPIIEPDADGNGFHMKNEYDASDTSYQYQKNIPDKLESLEALLVGHAEEINVVDEIKGISGRAFYKPAEKKIYVVRSSQVTPDEFFTAIANELVHENIASGYEKAYPRSANILTGMSAAYALGRRYGMDTGNIHLEQLPERYTKLSEKKAKSVLDGIRRHVARIDKDMRDALVGIRQRGREAFERN